VHDVAAVLVTTDLPPFATRTKIDITASAIGDATNLQGGTLVMTPMKGAMPGLRAGAGPVMTMGFVAGAAQHPDSQSSDGGRVPKEPSSNAPAFGCAVLAPEAATARSDFTTAARIVEVLNRRFATGGLAVARAESGAGIGGHSALYSTRRWSSWPIWKA